MNIGEILRRLRRETGFRQKDVAQYLQVSHSAISHYESGKNLPDAQTLVRIADFYGVSIDYIVGRTTLKLDWKNFQRNVNLPDGTTISLEQIVMLFLKLSDEGQVDIVKLMKLYLLNDQIRHKMLMKARPNKKEDRKNILNNRKEKLK